MAYTEFTKIDDYATGERIKADHYNTFADTLSELTHTGYGQYGYGQSEDDYATIDDVESGSKVYASSWTALATRIKELYNHQNGTSTATGLFNGVSVGAVIRALDGGTDVNSVDIQDNILSLQENSTTAFSDYLAYTSLATHYTTTTWYHRMYEVVDYTWDSADEARYFFNCGGRISIIYKVVAIGTTSRDTDWVDMLNSERVDISALSVDEEITTDTGTTTLSDDNTGYYSSPTDSATYVFDRAYPPSDGEYGNSNGSEDDDVYGMYAAAYAVDSGIDNIRTQISTLNTGVDGTNGDNGYTVRCTIAFYNPGAVAVHNRFSVVHGTVTPIDFTVSSPTVSTVTSIASTAE